MKNKSINILKLSYYVLITLLLLKPLLSLAQEPPDRDYLFLEDSLKKQKKNKDKDVLNDKALKKDRKTLESIGKGGKLPFDVSAKNLTLDSTGNKIIADGGLLITYSSMVIEAMKGVLDLTTNDVQVSGDVRISDASGTIAADAANINLKKKAGKIENADINFNDGNFLIYGKEVSKEEGDIYNITDAEATTCNCTEGNDCPPWRLRADSLTIERNGYGKAWGAKFDVFNIPVFYSPYFVFPAKTERQSGFLKPTFKNSDHSQFGLQLPFFLDISNSTDATITSIYESNIRYGFDNEFRTVFSKDNKLEAGFIYFNESMRGNDTLGTNTSGIFDPTRDENRLGGYIKQNWRSSNDSFPFQLISKGRFTSDNLLLREYENTNIGKYNTRTLVSKSAFRAPISSGLSLELSSEYNQSLVSDNDFTIQSFPEATLTTTNYFNPFGDNQLGLKLISQTELDGNNFVRKYSYDGTRTELNQDLKVPFHYKNIFDGSLQTTVKATQYNLNQNIEQKKSATTGEVRDISTLKDSSDRLLPLFTLKLNSEVEKVYNLDKDNLFKQIAELGKGGRNEELARIKHTVEPGIKYKFVPFVDQSDNPQFDSNDQLSQKNVVTYQLTQRILGRYEPRNNYIYGIEEATPEKSELGNLRSSSIIDESADFGFDSGVDPDTYQRLRVGSLKELVTFKLSQSYDILEAEKNRVASQSPYSDVTGDLILYPNDYLAFRQKVNYNTDDNTFSSYSSEAQIEDKRGDRIRARLTYNKTQFRQLESNLELAITERLKVGYYSRYDDEQGELIESKAGMRYLSSCNCYIFDIDFTDRINPDDRSITFNITLNGLGELTQKFFPTFLEDKPRNR